MLILRNIVLFLAFGLLSASQAIGQASEDQAAKAITATYALGEVVSNSASTGQMVLKTAAGEITVSFGEKTEFLQLPPGEKTLDKAVPISASDLQPGDRVMARGKVSEDRKTLPARQIIVMTKAAISERQAREKAEWRTRGVAGTVTALTPANQELSVRISTPTGPQVVTVHAGDKAVFRRYAPDSVKFADALPSSFADLKVGDQLRTLGNKDAAGTRVEAETIVFGSFLMAGGPVTAIDPEKGTLTIKNLQTKKPLTIVVNNDSMLRRIPDQFARMLAFRAAQMTNGGSPPGGFTGQRGPGSWQGEGRAPGGAEGRRPEGTGPAPPQPPGAQSNGGSQAGQPGRGPGGERPAGGGPGGGFGAGGGGGAIRSGDLTEVFQRLPAMTITDLKVGDLILVSSTVGNDPSRVTAIQLAAGVEPLLTEQAAEGSFSFPSGVFDVGMSMP